MNPGRVLSPQFLDELRSRTSLSGLIGRTVKLQKAGSEYKACCPFHQEKSPSFYVNDDKGFYHCFGCSAHGDAIRFLTEAQGMEFIDAVRQLVEAAGMEMPRRDAQAEERATRAQGLNDIVEGAATWFQAQLAAPGGAAARDYLAARGITTEAQRRFGIGFAPEGRRNLAAGLAALGEEPLVETGLLIRPEGGGASYDRFRSRLMIPIRNRRGRAIAFGGRILGAGEPKYLNSPETPLFDKGRTLFNLDRAAPLARKGGRLIVVEGYMDVIALDQAGIGEAVAPLGTALTESQIEQLWQLVDVPVLCFDGDAAGQRAALRAAQRAVPMLRPGKTLAFAVLPIDQDPDDVIRFHGPAALNAILDRATPLHRALYEAERNGVDMARPEVRAGLAARLEALAATIADPIVRREYQREFRNAVFQEFRQFKRPRNAMGPAPDVAAAIVRGVLAGAIRLPEVTFECIEQLVMIAIGNDDFRLLRDRIVHAALGACPAPVGLRRWLEDEGLSDVVAAVQAPGGLRFSFTTTPLPPHAADDLTSTLYALAEECSRDIKSRRAGGN